MGVDEGRREIFFQYSVKGDAPFLGLFFKQTLCRQNQLMEIRGDPFRLGLSGKIKELGDKLAQAIDLLRDQTVYSLIRGSSDLFRCR